jgi:hypothetical protein
MVGLERKTSFRELPEQLSTRTLDSIKMRYQPYTRMQKDAHEDIDMCSCVIAVDFSIRKRIDRPLDLFDLLLCKGSVRSGYAFGLEAFCWIRFSLVPAGGIEPTA